MRWYPVIDDRLRPHMPRCAGAYALTVDALLVIDRRAHDELEDAMERVRRHRAACDLCCVLEVMES